MFEVVDARRYWRCRECLATFLDPAQHPDLTTEKAEYDQHQNRADDPRYRAFLQPVAEILVDRLAAGSSVLDYGCGPGPALGQMLSARGYRVSLYDPIYRPDSSALQTRYDAVTCTEVVEHFHRPAHEFRRLDSLLRPGGWLVIMTRFQTDDARFAGWHYRRDPTHVVFYRPRTFEVLAGQYRWQLQCTPPTLVVIRKQLKPQRARSDSPSPACACPSP